MTGDILEVIDTTLDEWIELLRHPPKGKIFVRNMFPSDEHQKEWLRTSHNRSEAEVRLLLRHFLVSTGSNINDRRDARFLLSNINEGFGVKAIAEHDRRLLFFIKSKGQYPVWEGLGWLIDLLPQHPRKALNVIDAFFWAYWDRLTDNYLTGLFDV